jgi:uronate dehydrogenase
MARFKRILITGAAGRLGSVLRKEIAHLAAALRLSDVEDLGRAAPNEEIVRCDLADREAVMALCKDVDAVIHMGAIASEASFAKILEPNIKGFYYVYEGCLAHGVRRVVWGSSNHAVGFHPRTDIIDAKCMPRPDGNYGIAKVFGEATAQYFWDKCGIETVSMRIGSCFPEPTDRRMLMTWLSYRDMVHLVERSLIAPMVGHTIVYGASDNEGLPWDNRYAAHLGYRPRDNAEVFRGKVEAATPEPDVTDPAVVRIGGGFAAADHVSD